MPELDQEGREIVTLSTGVVLFVKSPSLRAIADMQVTMNRQKPKPPVVFIDSKQRQEENPADPDYIDALAQHQAEMGMRLLDVIVATGTALKTLPDGLMGPDDPDLLPTIEFMGIAVPRGKLATYAKWVTYFAAPSSEDWGLLMNALLEKTGTKEEDVAAALSTFRNQPA